MVDAEPREQSHHAQIAITDRFLDDGQAPAVINGAERVNLAPRFSWESRIAQDNCVGGCSGSCMDKSLQDVRRNPGNINGDQQIPVGPGASQGGFESAERSQTRMKIVPTDVAKGGVSRRRPQNSCRYRCGFNQTEHVNEEGMALPQQEGFISAHSGASASRQDITRRTHPRMVASEGLKSGYNRNNILGSYCFIAAAGLVGGLVSFLAPCSAPGASERLSRANRRHRVFIHMCRIHRNSSLELPAGFLMDYFTRWEGRLYSDIR
jgi:hypothetical protein